MMKKNGILLGMAALVLVACGGGSDKASTALTVGAAGATLKAGAATLTIPPNALTTSTQVTLREAEPRHQGRVERVEVEPHGLALAQPAVVSVKVDDSNPRVSMHNGSDDSLMDTEVEDRNHHEFKTSMSQLGEVEVEVEHAAVCPAACPTGTECDDGVCKPHNDSARTCTPVCATGQECDDGACKTHNEVEQEHCPTGTTCAPGVCTPACATGLECDNGVCKAHGGGTP
ncbi:MAG: hypothetical protein ACJ78T_09390 [Myxococcales bacterium]